MDTYRYKITQWVEVPAFTESDAWEAVQEVFGIGDANGALVVECEYEELGLKEVKKK